MDAHGTSIRIFRKIFVPAEWLCIILSRDVLLCKTDYMFFFNVILLGNFPYLNGGYVCCSAFVDYLTPSASYFWPSYLSFCDIGANPKSFLLESLVLNFLQLILRCVRAEPSVGLSLKVYAH